MATTPAYIKTLDTQATMISSKVACLSTKGIHAKSLLRELVHVACQCWLDSVFVNYFQ
jgi:hypothetical protein